MQNISLDDIKNSIRDVPDFPKRGILFKDLTTAFKEPGLLRKISYELVQYYSDLGITKVAGIESRGFILGSILAYQLNAGFVPIRKPGKLPSDIYSVSYELEYGTDSIEIHRDAIKSSDTVLLHDDLLATGGTARAAIEILQKFNVRQIYLNFIVELSFLDGRKKINPDLDIYSLISF
jgi:adenine phosphoribosyltransferase